MKKRISTIRITAPIITPIMTPLADGLVVAFEVVAVVLALLVAVPTAVEVVVLVLAKAAKTAKVLKWFTEAVIVWLTVSILTVVNCSHCPVAGLYQATYGSEPAGIRLGS